jgi:hypothetical protein
MWARVGKRKTSSEGSKDITFSNCGGRGGK